MATTSMFVNNFYYYCKIVYRIYVFFWLFKYKHNINNYFICFFNSNRGVLIFQFYMGKGVKIAITFYKIILNKFEK